MSSTTEIEVTSVYKLSDDETKEIENIFQKKTNKKISLINKIDESLIGGIKIKAGYKLWDLTIRSSLNKIKENMLKE